MSEIDDKFSDWYKKEVDKLITEKGYSADFARIIVGFSLQKMGRSLGKFPQVDFLSFFIEQANMMREEDSARADKLDEEFINFLEKALPMKESEAK